MRSPETQGERIRRARNAKGYTLEALSKRVGVSKALISHWELGKVIEIKEKNLRSLAHVLGVSQDHIVRGVDTPTDKSQPSAEEAELLERYRNVPHEVRPHLIRVVEALSRKDD